MRVKFGQLGGKFSALFQGLAHPEDAPAAHLDTGLTDHRQGVPAFLPRMGGDDVGEEGPRRLQIVVVAVHAHLDEPIHLLGGQHAQ